MLRSPWSLNVFVPCVLHDPPIIPNSSSITLIISHEQYKLQTSSLRIVSYTVISSFFVPNIPLSTIIIIIIIMNSYGLGPILGLLLFSHLCFGQPRHAVRSGHTANPVVTDDLFPFSCHMFSPFILVLSEYLQLCWILTTVHGCVYVYACPTRLNLKMILITL